MRPHYIKAPPINIFTMCNVKGVTLNDEPAESYHPTLPFPPALRSVLMADPGGGLWCPWPSQATPLATGVWSNYSSYLWKGLRTLMVKCVT